MAKRRVPARRSPVKGTGLVDVKLVGQGEVGCRRSENVEGPGSEDGFK